MRTGFRGVADAAEMRLMEGGQLQSKSLRYRKCKRCMLSCDVFSALAVRYVHSGGPLDL